MGIFLSTAIRALALVASALCLAAGATAVADWSLSLAACLPCVLVAEAAGIVAHRLRSKRELAAEVIHAEERFKYIRSDSTSGAGQGRRAA